MINKLLKKNLIWLVAVIAGVSAVAIPASATGLSRYQNTRTTSSGLTEAYNEAEARRFVNLAGRDSGFVQITSAEAEWVGSRQIVRVTAECGGIRGHQSYGALISGDHDGSNRSYTTCGEYDVRRVSGDLVRAGNLVRTTPARVEVCATYAHLRDCTYVSLR